MKKDLQITPDLSIPASEVIALINEQSKTITDILTLLNQLQANMLKTELALENQLIDLQTDEEREERKKEAEADLITH